ncbi:outer membrane lipoprotein-sorting protein [Vibrio maritimus]|uniref:outer membrane lipoprotein-sorting protein n=1 Tax=Vibrio maritimus TaxID=990268 RepID=UPI0040676CDA
MFNWIKKQHIVATLLVLFSVSGNAANQETFIDPSTSAAEILVMADKYRLEDEAAKVVTEVSLFQDGQLDKTRQYEVYLRPNRESLVLFKSQVEQGQKMLMLGDNYWLVMPKSRRPIRITPMQKLLGDASVGDVSTLTWSQDYTGTIVSDSQSGDIADVPTLHLSLTAKTAGASYQSIDLWVEKESGFPVRADLYLTSGKLAKKAVFESGERQGSRRVVTMTLLDQIQDNKKTVIHYQDVAPYELADKYYNPAYLSKNKRVEL